MNKIFFVGPVAMNKKLFVDAIFYVRAEVKE